MLTLKIFIVFLILMLLDKGLTVANILLVNKNFPEKMKGNYFGIEKNPLAKYFFDKLGLWNGTMAYAVIGLLTMIIGFMILDYLVGKNIAFYTVFVLYSIVIANNLFFMFRYAKIIS